MARRLVVFFLAITVIAAIVGWLAEHPGAVVIDWQAYRIETSVAAIILALVLILILAGLILRFARWLLYGRARSVEWRLRRRREKGEKAMARGLTALAAGDAAAANRYAEQAKTYLKGSPFLPLLQAQAARLAGDHKKAAGYYRELAGRAETDLLGLRGLLYQAIEAGDTDAAVKLARRAVRVRPRTEWAASALFDLAVSRADWEDAEAALKSGRKAGILSNDEAHRRRAVILLLQAQAQAKAKAAGGDSRAAGRLAAESHRLAPGLVPATILAAECLIREDKAKKARRLIENAWSAAPHPDVAALYREILADLPAPERLRFVEALKDAAPDNPESRLAVAETAVEAGFWGVARDVLHPLFEAPTPRVCRLMAAVAAGEEKTEEERNWLTRATQTPHRDPLWQCRRCGWEDGAWKAVCPRCQSFDSISWHTPTAALDAPQQGQSWRRLSEPGLMG